jgi:hypothetical protein
MERCGSSFGSKLQFLVPLNPKKLLPPPRIPGCAGIFDKYGAGSVLPLRGEGFGVSSIRPEQQFGPERLDVSLSATSSRPSGSSTRLTAEGLMAEGSRTVGEGASCFHE